MTNQFEGESFVNATFSAEMTLTDYVTQLVPQFSPAQIEQAVQIYSTIPGLDDVNDQAVAVMGECKFDSPAIELQCANLRLNSHLYLYSCISPSSFPGSRSL